MSFRSGSVIVTGNKGASRNQAPAKSRPDRGGFILATSRELGERRDGYRGPEDGLFDSPHGAATIAPFVPPPAGALSLCPSPASTATPALRRAPPPNGSSGTRSRSSRRG